MPEIIAGIRVPDSKLCDEVRELVRDTETELLYHHSNRVFLFGALTGERRGLEFDCELLYVGAIERMDPKFRRVNFCSLILESPWPT